MGQQPGYAHVNRIRALKPEALEAVVNAFRDRAGLVESREGFRGLIVLSSRDKREVLVITLWDSRDSFEEWTRSREFEEAHRRARERRLEGVESEGFGAEVVDFVVRGE